MLSVLEVTQRVPPTCIIKTDFTYPQCCTTLLSMERMSCKKLSTSVDIPNVTDTIEKSQSKNPQNILQIEQNRKKKETLPRYTIRRILSSTTDKSTGALPPPTLLLWRNSVHSWISSGFRALVMGCKKGWLNALDATSLESG
jgi:hypothetical protein